MKKLLLNCFCFALFGQVELNAQQTNVPDDKNLVEAILLCSSHKGLMKDLVASKVADTAKLNPKLNTLARNWDKFNHRRDSIKLKTTVRLPIEGTDKQMVLVYLVYRNAEWDEMLLLTSKKDNYLLDIDRPEDVFTFNIKNRTRYHNNTSSLPSLFIKKLPLKEEALQATKTIIRLVNAGKKDSLYQYIAYNRQNDPKRKYLEEPLSAKSPEDQLLLSKIYNDLRGMFASPESIYIEGGFKANPDFGSCSFRIVCKETKNSEQFYFLYRNGKYLLSK